MRKLLLFVSLFIWWGASAQTLPYTDNFESYTTGGYLAQQSGDWWTTWSNAPGGAEDGKISEAFSHSTSKAVLIEGTNDQVLKLGNKTTGHYELKWWMYVETGKGGYFNIQHFETPGVEWAYETYLNTDGSGTFTVGDVDYTFTYPKDTWFEVVNDIDLDGDNAKITINGTLVHEWPFSYQGGSTTGTLQLGAVNFFAGAPTGETPKYFFDDLSYSAAPITLLWENMESYAVDAYLAVSNPTWFTTWSGAPGTAEDSKIKNTYSHSTSKSAIVEGTTDLILKLGDKVSGKYELSWWTYVETGMAGYYNVQHFESPGTEYAFEVYFYADGTGILTAGDVDYSLTYPKATWFEVKHEIDLDADLVKLTINGTLIHEWTFSFQASSTTGTKQLGGVDFFAGAVTGETPKCYFDDVLYTQAGAPTDPIISVNPEAISLRSLPDVQGSEILTVLNTGASDLTFNTNIIYVLDGKKNAPVMPEQNTGTKSISNVEAIADPSPTPSTWNPVTDDFILHYDDENASAVGWNTVPVTATVAARFLNQHTLPHAGMVISSVDVMVNDLNAGNNDMAIVIYGMGSSYEPGELLYTQAFTPFGNSWEHIVLTTPVTVTGEELWIGYTFTQSDAGIYIPGTDAGPNDPNGDWIKSGIAWSHLSNNTALPYNWNIRANLTGTPIPHWLTVSPTSGTVVPDGSAELSVNYNTADLEMDVLYEGIIRLLSNDPVTPQLDVPVSLGVFTGINEGSKVAVAVYPNPANDVLNISTANRIVEVRILNLTGQVVLSSNTSKLNVSALPTGTYLIQVTTDNGIGNMKFNKN